MCRRGFPRNSQFNQELRNPTGLVEVVTLQSSHKCDRCLPNNSTLDPRRCNSEQHCLTLGSSDPIIVFRKRVLLRSLTGVRTCLRVWWWLCELGQARNRAALSKSVRYMRGQVHAPVFRALPRHNPEHETRLERFSHSCRQNFRYGHLHGPQRIRS